MANPNSAAANNNASNNNNSAPRRVVGGRSFKICGRSWVIRNGDTVCDIVFDTVTWVVEKFVLVLGPILIVFASLIIAGLSHTFFTILMPMIYHKHALIDPETNTPFLPTSGLTVLTFHVGMVLFLLMEICFNYFMCVMTPHKGPNYDAVVRELAQATQFVYPETPVDVEAFRREHHERIMIRMRRQQQRQQQQQQQQQQLLQQQSSEVSEEVLPLTTPDRQSTTIAATPDALATTPGSTTTTDSSLQGATTTTLLTSSASSPQATKRRKAPKKKAPPPSKKAAAKLPVIRTWMLMAPDEWGFCENTYQPKPPRAHYDHVSKALVLCLDHYCPWMFNAIGYFNYRYFCNFLWFVQLGMTYGAIICFEPFQNTMGPKYRIQLQEHRDSGEWKRVIPMVPFSSERLAISMSFMLCLAVGLAVLCLGGFHLYLVLTAQTTIEFHANFGHRKHARVNRLGPWKNPYSLGWRRNWQQVYGSQPWYIALLVPSRREPEFLPLPILGEEGRRPSRTHGRKQAGVELMV
eukprot:Nitzschia sp. Nitz4//scaffold28_size193895//150477//152134//NITZ4_001680-RA/size193895-augustus-gene-0.313-mRNA-1//-1//CDS//3329546027//2401//frame0